MRTFHLLLALLVTTTLTGSARVWWNPDKSRSFQGEFVKLVGETVHIKMLNGKVVPLTLEKLHEDDQKWARAEAINAKERAEVERANQVFGGVKFGDTREQVIAKLKESPLVTTSLADDYLARAGLNGIFETTTPIGPYSCRLFFAWDAGQKLSELSIHSESVPGSDYTKGIAECWQEMVQIMSDQYGKPAQSATLPKQKSLEDGSALNTHLWRLKGGVSALVGVGHENGGYIVIARFTNESVGL